MSEPIKDNKPENFTPAKLDAMKKGLAFYRCERCGASADVCGHACIPLIQANSGKMPDEYWQNPKGDNPTQKEIDETWNNNNRERYMLISGDEKGIEEHTKIPLHPNSMMPNFQQQQKPVSLIIGIPLPDKVDSGWSANFGLNFIPKQCPPNSGVIFENRYGIAQSREAIVNTFLQSQATHLLFYDSDILVNDAHAITTLINDTLLDPKKFIVSGCYYNSLYTGLAAWINDQPLNFKDPNNIINTSKDPLIEVDKVGMGLCIIRKDLFKLLVMEERPLFYYKIMEGNVMQSEDFVFFDKLSKYGIKPYIDNRVKAQHIKRCILNPDGTVSF